MRTLRPLLLISILLLTVPGSVATAETNFCGNEFTPPPEPPRPHHAPCNPNPQCCPDRTKACPGPCNASPCYAGSGTYVAQALDLTVPIVGGAISVNRSYSSARLVDGILGVGNSSMLQARLYYATYLFAAPSTYRSVADVVMPDGWQYRFIETTPGQFTPPATRRDVLVRNADGSFDLTLEKSRTVYHYLADGNAASIRDDAGNLTMFSYDGSGRLSRVADGSGSGRYVDVFWAADGRIASLRDSAGRIVSYTYNPSGSLASMTDPAGRQTTFSYVTGRFSTPLLSRVTDPWGRIVTDIAYLPTDQVFSYTENGETWRMSYNYQDDPRLTAKLDSSDNTWRLRFGSDIQITDRIAPDDSATNTVYSPEGWVQQQTDQSGILTSYTYDTAGKVTTVTRDAQTSSAVRYDYAYDAAFPEKVASVIPHDPATNLSDPDWQAWRYDYHPSGSASPGALFHVYRVQSDGTTLETVATYEYDTVGRVTRQASATGAQTDYSYDSSGNLQSVTGPANNDMGTRPQTTYAYDSLGRVTLVTDPLGHESTYTYDPLGRVLTVTLPKPSASSTLTFTTTYVYDEYDASTGLVFTRVTDPNGKVTRLGYDQFGRLARSVGAASGITSYSYSADVLSSITDANGNVTSYQYDPQRRLTRTIFPDGAYETYAYTVDGLLLSKTDRRAVTVTYGYDALKRLVTKSYSTGGTVTYSYQGQFLQQVQDTVASPPEAHGFSYDPSYRLATTTQASRGSLTYTYRPDDRVESMAVAAGPTATHGYYPDGSLRTTDWSPVTGSFRWDYTLPGQYQTVTLPIAQTRAYTYDDQGRLLQLGNSYGGTTLAAFSYGYDHDYALGTDTILGQRTSGATTLPAQGLTAALATYGYDSLYQLARTDYPIAPPFNAEVHQWTYDAIGNRLTNTIGGSTLAYSYLHNGANPLNGQRVQNDGVNAYDYDAAGNTTSRQGPGGNYTFDFDPENRLNAITGPVNATYTYDYQGRRTTRTVGGVTTTYLYDGLNLVSETTGGQTTHFLNGPGIDEPLAMAKSGAVSYFSVDGLGSVVATNDPTGAVTHSVLFDAWGSVKGETGTRAHPFTYTGREVGEAGFHFYRARFYQPGIGRFTQEDPIQDQWRDFIVQQDSAYSYAWNAPTAFRDPMGLYTRSDGVPPLSPDGDFFMNCLEICTGRPITVTESTGGRHADPGHAAGTSFDVRPNGAPSKTVFCCAKFCGAPYLLDERTRRTKFGNGAHYHVQLKPPGKIRPSAPNSIPPCPDDCPPIP